MISKEVGGKTCTIHSLVQLSVQYTSANMNSQGIQVCHDAQPFLSIPAEILIIVFRLWVVRHGPIIVDYKPTKSQYTTIRDTLHVCKYFHEVAEPSLYVAYRPRFGGDSQARTPQLAGTS
jgi:hypothetical protein